jgi:hypothetical protein
MSARPNAAGRQIAYFAIPAFAFLLGAVDLLEIEVDNETTSQASTRGEA